MKNVLAFVLLAVLVCSTLTEDVKKHHNKKKKHQQKSKMNFLEKHGFHKSGRAEDTIEVDLNGSKIKGKINETILTHKKYYGFQGIPYAKPPVGDLRFEPPEEYKLNESYDATYERSICIQNGFPPTWNIQGNEDCLYLNIYTPKINSSSSLPVMVWIHGGGFMTGSGNIEFYNPEFFIDNDIVMVTINYRLGVFGFLSTGDRVVPGNMGLKDQIMALKWVRRNIGFFGGNPDKVTIMGQSAGSASVSYLVQSPATQGLFRGAIAHSGNTLNPWSLSRRSVENTRILALNNLILSGNMTEIVARLKRVEARWLSTTSTLSMTTLFLLDPILNGLIYAPVIEPPNPTRVFSSKSYEQLDACNLTSVPMIIGYTSQETIGTDMMLGLFRFYLARYDLNPADLVPTDMNVNTTQVKTSVGNQIRETYFGQGGLVVTSPGLDKYLSDDLFVRGAVKYVKLYSKCGKNVYPYRFSYSPNNTGVGHAEDMRYFFYSKNLQGTENLNFSHNVVKLWTNFIKEGNPTPDNQFNFTWPASNENNNYSYLDIGKQFVRQNASTNPDKTYLDKWDYWYNTYGNRPYDTY